jgi:proline iminopeptidase
MQMKKPLFFLLLAAVALGLAVCSPPDVRLGMGDGDGVRLSYRTIGKGKPLIVIHDGPGYEKSLLYRGFDDLKSDMQVIYYDQRGCGNSQALAATMPSRIIDNVSDLEALRKFFHLETFSIAAHGWGAVIALEYARSYPGRVESIVLITPISPFTPGPAINRVIAKLPDEARSGVLTALNSPEMSMVDRRATVMKQILQSLFFRPEAMKDVNWRGLKYASDVNLRLGEELKDLELFPVLHEIEIPVLVVVGRHDISIPVRDQMAYADGITGASAVVFNRSGHFPFLEEHAFFVSLVREFLLRKGIPTLAGGQ